MGEVGGHGQVDARHNEDGAQVGGQELEEQDQPMPGVAQTSLQADGGHRHPGLAGHPE